MRLTERLLKSIVGKRSFYVTTPIFYVNAAPHIGHLYTAVIADCVQRFERLVDGHRGCEVVFGTGTDEHGTKIQQAAASKGVPLEQYCTSISEQYRRLFADSGVEFTHFIRTTEERHERAVHHFWNELKKRDYIYKAQYEGWYCVNDETFLTESHLKEEVRDGKKVVVSIDSGHPVEWTREENYMFKLSSLRSDLEYWMNTDGLVRPKKFHDILRGYLFDQYLPDISISRPADRVHWAIKVPDDPDQTVYVWLDALINYLTIIGYPNEKSNGRWPADIHVVGKDILKFHGLYWPAFLMAVGLHPPRKLLCHGHWTVDGKKMSKSLHNVVNPYDTIGGLEALRYFLLREGTMHSDANYSETKMLRTLNAELANTVGNLFNRSTSQSVNRRNEFPALHWNEFQLLCKNDFGNKLVTSVSRLPDVCREHYENHHFYRVVDEALHSLRLANELYNVTKPWNLARDPQRQKELDVILHVVLETLRVAAIVLAPVVPRLCSGLLDKLVVPEDGRAWADADSMSWRRETDVGARQLTSEKYLFFPRILAESKTAEASM